MGVFSERILINLNAGLPSETHDVLSIIREQLTVWLGLINEIN
jgi:hypothetical protein